MRICVYGASSNAIHPEFLAIGEELGREMARRGHGLVFGGGAQGMMGAAARGMTEGNGEIIGIAPSFFHVDGVLYEGCTQFLYTETMRQRKQLMEEHADGFLVTPGGIGTFEEFFEILTLRQLDRHQKPIAILNLRHYYDHMEKMLEAAMEQQFMRESCRELYGIFDTPAAALDYLEQYTAKTRDVSEYKIL